MPRRHFIVILALWLSLVCPALAETTPSVDKIGQILVLPPRAVAELHLPKDELAALYAARDNKPAWAFWNGDNTNALADFLTSLERVLDYHGLPTDAYPLAELKNAKVESEDDRAQIDVLVTASVLRLAHDLHGDTLNLSKFYQGWNFHRAPVDMVALVATAITAGNINDLMTSLTPKQPVYTKLAEALRSYRQIATQGGWSKIDSGPTLRRGEQNPRVAQLRARLEAEGYVQHATLAPNEAINFDEALAKAVETYQARNGLDIDGNIGGKTLQALNISLDARIDQIRANMERWRHMPDDFPPERYMSVNIAAATVDIVEGGKAIYHGPVVIGKIDRKTPFIQSRVHTMVVNPIWHVPTKIARKDILPKLKKDPHYLEKLGFIIKDNENDPQGLAVDWAAIPENEFNYRLRQMPGDQNSLGQLKFEFVNDFAVYMHGTPHQELFGKSQRNFSSGCIRLQEPDHVAEILLKDNTTHWDATKIGEEIAAGKTRWVALANQMPIYVLYWSVFFDDETGAVQFRKDAYDYDRILDPTYRPPKFTSVEP